MADMIDAKEAKQILGCDDDALNNHINGGTVRAQRIGGKLMVNKEDVLKVAAEQDDGTIVLTGDSDNLQIDLGKVVDDTSETLIQANPNKNAPTDSITFGDELEVINFEDNKATSELAFDDSKKTMDLNFTDQNTAVMTAVDETQVGATTAQLDTSNDASPVNAPSSSESRRSVRSNRVRVEIAPVHPMWVAFMALTTLIMAFFITPYLVMAAWPRGEDRDAAKNQARGVDDNFWTSMASTMSGFSTEPSKKRFEAINGTDRELPHREVPRRAQGREREARLLHHREDRRQPGHRQGRQGQVPDRRGQDHPGRHRDHRRGRRHRPRRQQVTDGNVATGAPCLRAGAPVVF
jgi:hypothetical protein